MLRLLRLSSKQSSEARQAQSEVPVLPQSGLQYKRIALRPIESLEQEAWKRIHKHFRDKEIAHLNGTKPSRMPLWLLKRILKTDAKRVDRETFGIYTSSIDANETNANSIHTSGEQSKTKVNQNNAVGLQANNDLNLDLKQALNLKNIQTSFYYQQFPEYIGTIELYDMNRQDATLGIIIGEKAFWSKGYGPEAIYALLCHAFDTLNLRRVKLNTYGDNLRAQRSFKRIGFVETKRVKNYRGREDIYMELKRDAWKEFLRNPPPWHMLSSK